MTRIGFLLVLTAASLASAQESWPAGRLLLTGGADWQNLELLSQTQRVRVDGLAPAARLQVSAAVYPSKWFGIALEARGSMLAAVSDAGVGVAPPRLEMRTGQVQLLASARWQVSSAVGLEAQVGVEVAARPKGFEASPMTSTFSADPQLSIGPALGLVASFDPSPVVGLQAFVRGSTGVNTVGYATQAGVQGRVSLLQVGPLGLGLGLSAEAQYFSGDSRQEAIAVGLGLAATWRTEVRVPASADLTLSREVFGQVRRSDESPVAGSTVTLDGAAPQVTDAQGQFRYRDISAGSHRIAATLAGLRRAEQTVQVPQAGPVEVVLRLAVPTGPGRLIGTVKTSAGVVMAALPVLVGGKAITTDAQGRLVAESVGPGPVPIQVKAPGFGPVDEVAQVPAEGEATIDVVLEPEAVKSKAKFRGIVSSADGPVAKATVRVIERKLKVTVSADGRFAFEVPAGTYTLVIEAAKYVAQTRRVEVAEGDQAIFQVELERSR